MNKKGVGMPQVAIILLLALVVGLIYVVAADPDFSDEIDAARELFEIVSWVVMIAGGFLILWKIKFFGLIK